MTTRRIIQPELAQAVTASLAKCGGTIYVSSDYIEVAEEMRDMLLSGKRVFTPSASSCARHAALRSFRTTYLDLYVRSS